MEIGDTVLHPKYGIGIIKSIEERQDDGKPRNYYVIPKPSISVTVLVAVDAADEVGLRPLSTTDKLKKAISILSGEADDTNLHHEDQTISWGDPIELARAIRNDAIEPKQRYPKTTRKRLLKHAKKLLGEELSAVLGMSEESITELVGNA